MAKDFAKEAFENGILEKNHRSEPFMHLLEDCITLLKNHLNIPSDYKVFFVSSATEAWEICAQSLFGKAPAKFYYNGAFGEKWMKYSEKIHSQVSGVKFELEDEILADASFVGDVCLVANETSNGTQVNPASFKDAMSDKSLLYVDAVSSLGGVDYQIRDADVWISSSQKCFGLPSGMGIMIVSPKAQARAKEIGDRNFYNSLLFVEENFNKHQTPYTPNILSVYLLKRLLENLPNIKEISNDLTIRAKMLYDHFDGLETLQPLISNGKVRSQTLVAITCSNLPELDAYLTKNRITIGKGYGEWKDSTFRIANFPSIDNQEYDYLLEILSNFVKK